MKKLIAVFLLFALLLTACGEANVDTSSQDVSSEIVSQESSEETSSVEDTGSADVSSENEEDLAQFYVEKAKESLAVENPQEIIDALKAKDENFEKEINGEGVVFEFDTYPLIQVYEYSLREYAETGKITPRPTEQYFAEAVSAKTGEFAGVVEITLAGDYPGISMYGNYSTSGCDFLSNIKRISAFLTANGFNAEKLSVKAVAMGSGMGNCFYVTDSVKEAIIAMSESDYKGTTIDEYAFFSRCATDTYGMVLLNDETLSKVKEIKAEWDRMDEELKQYKDRGENPPTGGDQTVAFATLGVTMAVLAVAYEIKRRKIA